MKKKIWLGNISSILGYALELLGLYLCYRDHVVLALICIFVGVPLLLGPLFYMPIKKRFIHRKALKQYLATNDFSKIDKYNDNKIYKASYSDRIMYINHYYKVNYISDSSSEEKNSIVDFSKHRVLKDEDIDTLSKRLLFLSEQIRNEDIFTGFKESLILSVFFPFISKNPEGQEWEPVVLFFIAVLIYFIYYVFVRLTDKIDETTKLNEYEIEIINSLLIGADTPQTDKAWREKMDAQVITKGTEK